MHNFGKSQAMIKLSVAFFFSPARSHRCSAAVLRHTKSLSNHFALSPLSHRGPVSVLAGYSALFISAPGSYLLSPGSQMKLFFLPKREDQIALGVVFFSLFLRPWPFKSSQFISVPHRRFLFFITLSKLYLLGGRCIERNPIYVLLHGRIKTFHDRSELSPARCKIL